MKVLLAEDERELSSIVVKALKANNIIVDAVFDGQEALIYLDMYEYDCVILDIMMPKLDGISTLKKLRAKGNNVPVIILTAKSEIDDRVVGLDSGADDYLSKPFAIKELLARIRALSRRKGEVKCEVCMGNTVLDTTSFELCSPKGKVRLTAKEFQLMELLLNNPTKIFASDYLMDKIWGYESDAEMNVVWVYISALRKKLVELESNLVLKSMRGLGYKLEVV